ncbi:mitochondrial GTPase 1-like isoform X1 [Formica exsecta]|uniref:mitochondrial GTPase 1-like isoform X1 n=1 Tax=Formica exsecta TaxID=72781 RepID=UPI001144026B|nr:mitochondrial GTPase 1-like isoform X1 [Formica exsecta]XP_029661476.1 mitochondrial GTPase 1-like isoform X1 [Formica exsecta]XP_029661477.1 mitochondrial GTPase 1-like isoform X1 [Formica exsecta]XP_029661478.1 mitochondrial GTPase 1-like isoform X1 [Formica exsecta]
MTNTGGKVVANLRQKFVLSQKAIRWFPGHMTKGLKQMQQRLKNVDCILEVHDARVPISGRYADFSRTLTGLKPHILVLSKKDLADTKYSESIVSTLNREGLSNIIFTNLKDEKCRNMKKILPLAKKLISNSARYNRAEEESYSIMVIGVPNVGKSSLINRLRSHHLNMAKATHVGAEAGITRSVLTRIKISEDPTVYLFDTPGILAPSINDIHAGFKLSLVGCLQDHVVGTEMLADYLLFWLNKNGRFEYVEKLGLSAPNDDIIYVLTYIAAKFKKTMIMKTFDRRILTPNLQFAADYFISLFRTGKLGSYCLDIDLIETSQDCDIRLA